MTCFRKALVNGANELLSKEQIINSLSDEFLVELLKGVTSEEDTDTDNDDLSYYYDFNKIFEDFNLTDSNPYNSAKELREQVVSALKHVKENKHDWNTSSLYIPYYENEYDDIFFLIAQKVYDKEDIDKIDEDDYFVKELEAIYHKNNHKYRDSDVTRKHIVDLIKDLAYSLNSEEHGPMKFTSSGGLILINMPDYDAVKIAYEILS